ncbi:MAG TPA: GTPase HflX [bacterium]
MILRLFDKPVKNSKKTLKEKAILVGVYCSKLSRYNLDESLSELKMLADTAGAEIVDMVTQKMRAPDSRYLIGKGKVAEMVEKVAEKDADIVIFDEELSPSQQRNLEESLNVRIVDRTALILDIFASRAKSREGKLQVELAQLNYLLPRLTGHGVLMSRLGGGIGTRGPGETKLEIDRRRIRERISTLKREISSLRQTRHLHRERRHFIGVSVISIVGYTNSGKSTLFNRLTRSNVLSENKLFATLDPTVRMLRFKNGERVFLVDTVGFIKKLPHQLIEAFRSTFEEVTKSDGLIHLIDASHPNFEEQIEIVNKTLSGMLSGQLPVLHVFNKIDIVENREHLERVISGYPGCISISALTGEGIEKFLDLVNITFRGKKDGFSHN